ncbi:MAG: hypothetical protein ABWZ67_09960 [Solirubrobacteraceae bacterium]
MHTSAAGSAAKPAYVRRQPAPAGAAALQSNIGRRNRVQLVRSAREHGRDGAGEVGDRVGDVKAVAQLDHARGALAGHGHVALDRVAEGLELL